MKVMIKRAVGVVLCAGLMQCTTTSPNNDETVTPKKARRKYTMEPKSGSKQPGLTQLPTPNPSENGKVPPPIPKPTSVPLRSADESSVNNQPQPAEPTREGSQDTTGAVLPKAPPALVPTPATIANSNCLVLPAERGPLPIFIRDKNFIVTRLLSTCTTPDGQSGYEKNTQWMAMGFPCTGGRGKIEYTDKYIAPKLVAFLISNNCPMSPQDPSVVASITKAQLGLSEGAKLLAYTPFAPQFWEVLGQSEADVGYAIELRTPQSLSGLWTKVRDGQPLRVRMYGRENAWVQGERVYEVEGDIVVNEKRFKLELVGVKALSDQELDEVKARCEALRPKRNCSNAF